MTREPVVALDDAGRLIGHDGTLYPKITWRSALERKLVQATKLPSRARRLADACARWFPPERASAEERAALEAWVIETAPYLGTTALDLLGDFAARHPAWHPELAGLAAREAPAFAGFLADVAGRPALARQTREPRRIVVLFGDLGGGTERFAEAVVELLRETGRFEPIPLSAHADAVGPRDPMYCAFGTPEPEIWNRFFLDGSDTEAMDRYRATRRTLGEYFAPSYVEDALRLITAHDADHVLAALPGYTLLAQVAGPSLPLTFLHADFGLNPTLLGEDLPKAPDGSPAGLAPYRMFDPERVTIGLSSDQAEPALDAVRAALGPQYDRLIHVIGYPTLRAFSRLSSRDEPEKIDRLRAELGVSEGEKLVLLMMGRDGMGDRLIELARRLVETPPAGSLRLHVVAVCGRSERSRQAIESFAERAVPRVRLRVAGLLGPREIAGYMHLAAAAGDTRGGVVVSKPGGATTAECAETGAYMLLVPGFPWELGNQNFALRHGFGELFSDDDFLPKLGRILCEPPSPPYRPVDWRSHLLAHLARR